MGLLNFLVPLMLFAGMAWLIIRVFRIGKKRCSQCAELVRKNAKICKHCGERI